MCVKIVKDLQEVPYDASKPLVDQVDSSDLVVINYEPKDKAIVSFMKELEKMAKTGVETNFNVRIEHRDNLKGARIKKQINKLKNDISVNELIKAFVQCHKEADKKLEELIGYCSGVGYNVK